LDFMESSALNAGEVEVVCQRRWDRGGVFVEAVLLLHAWQIGAESCEILGRAVVKLRLVFALRTSCRRRDSVERIVGLDISRRFCRLSENSNSISKPRFQVRGLGCLVCSVVYFGL